MKMLRSISTLLVAFVLILSFASCSNNDPAPVALTAVTFKNLSADPPSGGYNPTNGQPIGVTNKFTFFSFSTGALVVNADSTTTKWDVGFRGTTLIVNSGSSGKGTTKVQVLKDIFDNITTAPDAGYLSDSQTDNKKPVATSYAIPLGSGNGWYNYDRTTNIVSPIAGRVLIFQMTNGNYAKMEILNYYQDAPIAPIATTKDRYYTFRYIYQPNGGKSFK
ncbi:MAG: HmuY family protein [Cyclobacteriaceae bacterium]